jgi:hypothetical protein
MVVGAGSAAPGVAADPALHAVLLGDGRLLTDGTGNPNRNNPTQQTGFFIYDIWGPDLGMGPESHSTLPKPNRDRPLLQRPDRPAAEREGSHHGRRQL